MIVKVSDYISDILVKNGIDRVFLVPGGGAMHLNDSFGHDPRLKCLYQHHEQACAIAAEAYARMLNRPAVVNVTTGPGATNAITGVLCAWMESYPMIVISGQARYATTVKASGLKLRSMGNQECDIVELIRPITKYADMPIDPYEVPYQIEKAIYIATHGRKGPVWIDIPLDVQAAKIDTDKIKKYDPAEDREQLPHPLKRGVCSKVIERIKNAKRPVLFVGAGVRSAGAYDELLELVDLLGIPVVNGMSSADAIWHDHPLFVGRSAATGSRAGNFAVQNADVLLSIGSRQSFAQTGFAYEKWAREAFTIINDIDPEELKKPNLHVSLGVPADAKEFINGLIKKLKATGVTEEKPLFDDMDWLLQCMLWKEKYPVVTPSEKGHQEDGKANIYYFFDLLSKYSRKNDNIVVACGTSRVSGTQAIKLKEGQRFITNSATATMGYGLPAAIGVSVASGMKPVTVVTGEGSLMMNLQELQTIVTNKIPVRIFLINNEGYHSIRQTEKNFFGEPLIGVGPESGDLGFPEMGLVGPAMGFAYCRCESNEELPQFMADLEQEFTFRPRPMICEVMVSKLQSTMPKTATRKLDDGQMVSTPLEDMAPFLSREELEENMIIPLSEEEKRN